MVVQEVLGGTVRVGWSWAEKLQSSDDDRSLLKYQKFSSAPPHVSSRHNFSNPQIKETSVCIPKNVEYSQDVNSWPAI